MPAKPKKSNEIKPATTVNPANRKPAPDHIIRKVGPQPVSEGGQHYAAGSDISLSKARAKSLGGLLDSE